MMEISVQVLDDMVDKASEAGKTRRHFIGCGDLARGIGRCVMISVPALGVDKILFVLLEMQGKVLFLSKSEQCGVSFSRSTHLFRRNTLPQNII